MTETAIGKLFKSLWPAIALHGLIDLSVGMMAWLTLREGSATGDVVEVAEPALSTSAVKPAQLRSEYRLPSSAPKNAADSLQ